MNKITKKCYEQRFKAQKYIDSVLCSTFDDLLDNMVQEAKKEVFDDFDKLFGSNEQVALVYAKPEYYDKIKKHHLSTDKSGTELLFKVPSHSSDKPCQHLWRIAIGGNVCKYCSKFEPNK